MNPLDLVLERNVRDMDSIKNDPEFEKLVANMKSRLERGLPAVEEPVAYYQENGSKIVKHGHRRTLAAIAAGATEIRAVRIERPDDEYLAIDQIVANVLRKDLNPMEIARALGDLHRKGVKSTEIAEKMGMSEPWVSQHLGLLSLTEELQDAVAYGELSKSAGYEASTMPTQDQERFMDQIIAAKTVKGVKTLRRNIAKIREQETDRPVQQIVKADAEQIVTEEQPGDDLLRVLGLLDMATDFARRAQAEATALGIDIEEHVKLLKEVVNGL